MTTPTPSKLTPLQSAFVSEYVKDFNATRSYQRAVVSVGKPLPSEKTAAANGARMIGNDNIQAHLSLVIQKRNERVQIDQDYVIRHLIMNLKRALQAVPVLDKEGNETGMWQYNGSVANGALALLAKHTGGFADRMEHTGPGGGPIQMAAVHIHVISPEAKALTERITSGERLTEGESTRGPENNVDIPG